MKYLYYLYSAALKLKRIINYAGVETKLSYVKKIGLSFKFKFKIDLPFLTKKTNS